MVVGTIFPNCTASKLPTQCLYSIASESRCVYFVEIAPLLCHFSERGITKFKLIFTTPPSNNLTCDTVATKSSTIE